MRSGEASSTAISMARSLSRAAVTISPGSVKGMNRSPLSVSAMPSPWAPSFLMLKRALIDP